jgi:hypothetical protein
VPYQPIENYGVIGDLRTAALIGKNGSLDWLCLPHFDSPSVFAAILDDGKGGSFHIAPTCEDVTTKQLYWPDTNILVTRFLSPSGVAEVLDFMPVEGEQQLVRRVRCVRGEVTFRALCQPAFNYARDPHVVKLSSEGAVFRARNFSLALATPLPLQLEGRRRRRRLLFAGGGDGKLRPRVTSVDDAVHPCPSESEMEGPFSKLPSPTGEPGLSKCSYQGRWRETVQRSALL